MELEGSSPHSQVLANCHYPEPDQSTPCPPSHFLMIRLDIILPSTPGSSKWFLPPGFPTKTLYTPLLSPILATCPAHLILYLITRIIFGEDYRSLSSSLCSFLHSPVTSPLLGSNVFLSTLFANTLGLRSSLNVTDQVSTPIQINRLNYSFVYLIPRYKYFLIFPLI